jgi:hypothetical protein
MVLEHCIAALKDGFTDIKILSDSQTAVGILTQLEVSHLDIPLLQIHMVQSYPDMSHL